jgi:D-3-phosphoglycerate dehydrogenase / 2-oxoglutarate reductase
MLMKKVLLSEPIADDGISLLTGKAEIVVAGSCSEESVLADIKDIFGIILRSKTKITRRILESAPELRIIARTGTGYDNVDVQAASDHNVMVCNLPGINAVSVAEQTMTFILALAKKIIEVDGYVRNGMWSKRSENPTIELEGKTLGILGLGQIGFRVMKMAQAFGMKTLVSDPFVEERHAGQTAFATSLGQLFETADFITVHVPNMPQNRHLVTENLLMQMKRTAFIINTSRGEVIDEKALIKVLQQNRIAGAALDVFENEPLTAGHPFIDMKNVILSPHIAALTKECGAKMTMEAVSQVIECLEGRIPPHIVNRAQIKL